MKTRTTELLKRVGLLGAAIGALAYTAAATADGSVRIVAGDSGLSISVDDGHHARRVHRGGPAYRAPRAVAYRHRAYEWVRPVGVPRAGRGVVYVVETVRPSPRVHAYRVIHRVCRHEDRARYWVIR